MTTTATTAATLINIINQVGIELDYLVFDVSILSISEGISMLSLFIL